jgi:hypothetical protein
MKKSNAVRFLDVVLIAPYLIDIAKKGYVTKNDRYFLIILGVATLVYNGYNLIYTEKNNIC